MKKILIGNDINFRWVIKNKENQPIDLKKSQVVLKIIHQELPEATFIPPFSVNVNEISISFPAEKQKHLGIYHLQLTLKDDNTVKIVNRNTFCLSDIYEYDTSLELTEKNENIQIEVIHVENEVSIVNGKDGKSAYEVAVVNGFTGTEQEWLDSLKADINDQVNTLYNSDGRLTSARTVTTNGKPLYIKGLPDKSSDNSFIKILGCNHLGQLAPVGFSAFKETLSLWTDTEKQEYTQLLNGGFNTGSISVGAIFPSTIENSEDTIKYICLKGANLNLHPTEHKIEILDSNLNVITEIPNSQVQIYSDGLTINFYFNFVNFPIGDYKIKITSGVKTYISPIKLFIVNSTSSLNFQNLSWNLISNDYNDVSASSASGTSVVLKNKSSIKENTPNPIISAKSDTIFKQEENFYLELNLDILSRDGRYSPFDDLVARVGIVPSQNPNSLSFLPTAYAGYSRTYSGNYIATWTNSNKKDNTIGIVSPVSLKATIVKKGSQAFVSFNNSASVTDIEDTDYSLCVQLPNRSNFIEEILSVTILKAYKF